MSVLNEKRFNIYNNMNINIYILLIINCIIRTFEHPNEFFI